MTDDLDEKIGAIEAETGLDLAGAKCSRSPGKRCADYYGRSRNVVKHSRLPSMAYGRGLPMAISDSQRHSGLSSTQLAELMHLSGTDPILRQMFKRGYPMNRETYIALNWGPDSPEVQGAEFELEIPEPFRCID
jgi:hypothetical protein